MGSLERSCLNWTQTPLYRVVNYFFVFSAWEYFQKFNVWIVVLFMKKGVNIFMYVSNFVLRWNFLFRNTNTDTSETMKDVEENEQKVTQFEKEKQFFEHDQFSKLVLFLTFVILSSFQNGNYLPSEGFIRSCYIVYTG